MFTSAKINELVYSVEFGNGQIYMINVFDRKHPIIVKFDSKNNDGSHKTRCYSLDGRRKNQDLQTLFYKCKGEK